MPRNDDFQSLMGALLYVAGNTRPKIAISASILGRKVSNPLPSRLDGSQENIAISEFNSRSEIETW